MFSRSVLGIFDRFQKIWEFFNTFFSYFRSIYEEFLRFPVQKILFSGAIGTNCALIALSVKQTCIIRKY